MQHKAVWPRLRVAQLASSRVSTIRRSDRANRGDIQAIIPHLRQPLHLRNQHLADGGNFATNARETLWCTGTNIIRHSLITKKLPPPKNTFFAATSPEVGTKSTSFYGPGDHSPLHGATYVTWLAFCSGSFLKVQGREIRPFDAGNHWPFTDKTLIFTNAPGLPERVELHRKRRQGALGLRGTAINELLRMDHPGSIHGYAVQDSN